MSVAASYTLMCEGTGGSIDHSVQVTVVPPSTSRFPLHTEAGKRYLVDAQGNAFLIHGDAAWALFVRPTKEKAAEYLDDRQQRGFNTVLVNLIDSKNTDDPPNNAYGDGPFTTSNDFSTPNEAYFAHVDEVIGMAAARGMLVLLEPAYEGFNGGYWFDEMQSNGATKLRDYGRYVATRLAQHDNILWAVVGDYDTPNRSLARAVAEGIRDVETKWPHTAHMERGTAPLQFWGTGESWLDVNNIYTDRDDVVSEAYAEYARSPMPYFLIEARYEGATGITPLHIRQQAWQAVLSGASGHIIGNESLWRFTSGWEAALDSPGTVPMVHLRDFMASLPWWTLQPDVAGEFLTAGIGSGSSRAAAAVSADSRLGVVYIRDLRDLTVDLGQLAGASVTARWFDPTNGAYTTVSGSPFDAVGPKVLSPPGINALGSTDWALVLESVP